jgi:hypothetical protein
MWTMSNLEVLIFLAVLIAIAGAVMLTVALTTSSTGGRVAASTTEAESRTAMADRTPERTQSHAFAVLRPSSRRLLMFIETEIARSGGGSVTLCMDQFEVVGSRSLVLPGLSELHALGLIEVTRLPKRQLFAMRHLCAMSERWRDIRTLRDAKIVSVVARVQRKPQLPPSQPASVSASRA